MSRAGASVRQPTGYRAFLPAPLPPDPPVRLDGALLTLLSQADRMLARLDGVASMLPNPDLFAALFVQQEAVLSSQIEGTQSTLEDVLQENVQSRASRGEVDEVVNYVAAMNAGLAEIRSVEGLPLSTRLLTRLHGRLLQGSRGAQRSPGAVRTSQNWIGPEGATLATATFVPPPPHALADALGNLDRFLHDRTLPDLVVCGLAHAQFETIHPFLDGNGRIGRLLITLLLCEREILERPLLYLSLYLKRHRAEYYDRLTAIRVDGDWEGWLRFFLSGIVDVSRQATFTARSILHLREAHRTLVAGAPKIGLNGQRLLDLLFEQPVVDVRYVEARLGISYGGANVLVRGFERLGLLAQIGTQKRNRLYRYAPYLRLFASDAPLGDDDARPEITGAPSAEVPAAPPDADASTGDV